MVIYLFIFMTAAANNATNLPSSSAVVTKTGILAHTMVTMVILFVSQSLPNIYTILLYDVIKLYYSVLLDVVTSTSSS